MKNGITENYNDKNKSENKIKLIVHILFIMFKHLIVTFETPCICHIYPPFTRKRIVSLNFGRDVRIFSVVAISELPGPPVFHTKVEASR